MMSVGLLAAAVAMLLFGHHRVPTWAAVTAPVAVGVATRSIRLGDAADAVRALDASLAFLAVAVPLAVLLGRVGFFDAAAERVASGRRLVPGLWCFAAIVTTVFNLDAAIVLLTPLYVRIARRHGLDPVRLAFQPVLLASLASSALPVSNLTNLIVADRLDATTGSSCGGWGRRRCSRRPRAGSRTAGSRREMARRRWSPDRSPSMPLARSGSACPRSPSCWWASSSVSRSGWRRGWSPPSSRSHWSP